MIIFLNESDLTFSKTVKSLHLFLYNRNNHSADFPRPDVSIKPCTVFNHIRWSRWYFGTHFVDFINGRKCLSIGYGYVFLLAMVMPTHMVIYCLLLKWFNTQNSIKHQSFLYTQLMIKELYFMQFSLAFVCSQFKCQSAEFKWQTVQFDP